MRSERNDGLITLVFFAGFFWGVILTLVCGNIVHSAEVTAYQNPISLEIREVDSDLHM